MSADDDFYSGIKSDKDKMKEWVDSAEFFIDIRRPREDQQYGYDLETEKVAVNAKAVGEIALSALHRIDRTGLSKAMSTKPGAIAGLTGAALFGIGTALSSRGKKELGGKSRLENALAESKAKRDSEPEPKSFSGKVGNHFSDLSASFASTARKHPIKAGLTAAFGGAKAGTTLLSKFAGKR